VRNHVVLYRTDERTFRIHEGYELNAHGRLAWLHRWLWRMLNRMGAVAPAMKECVEIIRLPVDNDSIFQRIFEARHDLFNRNRRPAEVLIGPNTLSELISCPEIRDYGSPFSLDARAGFGKTIFNLPIRVIPQMEGVIVLDERP
jgi:hypothetical protein